MGWQDGEVVAELAPRVQPWQRGIPVEEPVPGGSGVIAEALKQHFQPRARSANSFEDYISAGFQQSVTGLATRGKAPEVGLDENTPWYGRAAASVATIAGDLPAMVPGFMGGAAAGGAAGTAVPVVGNITGAVVGGFAGAGALPAALRSAMMEAYTKGEVTSASDFVHRALNVAWETTKGAVVGGATGGAGIAAKAALPVAAGAVAQAAAPTAAQIVAMTTVGKGLEGQLPEPQDFLDAAVILGGMQGAGVVAGRLRTIYAKTGIPPEQVLADAQRDPSIKADLTVGDVLRESTERIDAMRVSANAAAEAARRAEAPQVSPGSPPPPPEVPAAAEAMSAIERTLNQARSEYEGIPEAYRPIAEAERGRQIVPGEKAAEVAARPFAEELPQAIGEPSKPTHVNYNYINTAEDTKLALARVSEVYEAEIQTQRRGTVSWEQTSNEAAKILSDTLGGVDTRLLMPREPGTPAGAAEILARKQLTVGAAEAMMAARDELLAKGAMATEAEKLAFLQAVERTAMIQSEFLGVRAEAGRALNILKQTAMDAKRANEIQNVIDAFKSKPTEKPAFDPKAPFAKNTIFTLDKVEAARARLKAKLGTLNAGLDPEVLQAGLTIAGAYVEAGLRDFASFSKAMIDDLGEKIKPHLKALYDGAIASEELQAKQTRDVIDVYGDPIKMAQMMSAIDNPAGALKFAREAVKASTWEKVVEAWKAGILSGPVTHVANILGNGTFIALRVPVDAVASVLGRLHGGERVSAMEPVAHLVGAMQGTLDGLKLAGAVLTESAEKIVPAAKGAGDAMRDAGIIAKEAPNDISKAEQRRGAIEGTKGEVVRLPFAFLKAEDAIFTTMNERASLYSQAVNKATSENLSPLSREFRERVAQLVETPTREMLAESEKTAERFTFNPELGEKGKAVQKFVRTWGLEWMVPFIRTPGNVMKELTRMTPLAPLVKEWREAFAEGGAARDKAIAEVAVGTGIMSAVFMKALDGDISGAGDPDPGKRRIQLAAGWQPYSVKVNGTWYNYQRLQPLGTLVGMAADVANVWDHLTEEEADKVPKMLSVAFANAVTNQTFLQGITNFVNATSDPTRFGPKLVQQFAGSAVPAIVAQPTAMLDPVQREVDSVLDAVKSRLPGLRQSLLPKRDAYGEPMQAKERAGVVSPITTSEPSDDKVRTEAARLGVSVADTPKKTHIGRGTGKLGDVKLEPEERDRFAEIGGKLAHQLLDGIVNQPGWDDLPTAVQKRTYERVFASAHKVAAMQAMPMDKRVGLAMEISEKVIQSLQPEDATQ